MIEGEKSAEETLAGIVSDLNGLEERAKDHFYPQLTTSNKLQELFSIAHDNTDTELILDGVDLACLRIAVLETFKIRPLYKAVIMSVNYPEIRESEPVVASVAGLLAWEPHKSIPNFLDELICTEEGLTQEALEDPTRDPNMYDTARRRMDLYFSGQRLVVDHFRDTHKFFPSADYN